MAYADDPEDFERRLRAKMQPRVICSTLAFAGLYQMTHEAIRHDVVDQVRNFYMVDHIESRRADYEREVLALASGKSKAFKASLMWLVNREAVTQEQADRLDAIYDHRHALAHELMAYVFDPDKNPDMELFIEATHILKALDRFWVEIEIAIGSFEHMGDVDADEVVSGTTAALQTCISAYTSQFVDMPTDEE